MGKKESKDQQQGYTSQPFAVWGAVQKLWKKRQDTAEKAPGGKKRKK